jgi:AhpD family alkylhydroperoxidase
MQTRLDYGKAAPGSVQAMYKLQKYVDESGLEHSLLELVKTRVSQINGCAFCIDMHTKDARAAGETEQRLYGLLTEPAFGDDWLANPSRCKAH